MEGHARISADVLARYAADAALEVEGVHGLTEGHLPRRGAVRISDGAVELHLSVEWGAPIPEVGRAVQERVREYLARMADMQPASVEVVVDAIAGS
jgi:uncharacterized alkaline shock family protein YloU